MNNMYPFNPINNTNPYLLNNPIYSSPVRQGNDVIGYNPTNVQTQVPQRQIDTANGREGAMSYVMGPNSGVILADAVNPKIWVVTTDSSGVKAVKGFKIIPDEDDEPKDPIALLTERLDRLEERMNNYGKPNPRHDDPNKYSDGIVRKNGRDGTGCEKPNGGNQPNGNE